MSNKNTKNTKSRSVAALLSLPFSCFSTANFGSPSHSPRDHQTTLVSLEALSTFDSGPSNDISTSNLIDSRCGTPITTQHAEDYSGVPPTRSFSSVVDENPEIQNVSTVRSDPGRTPNVRGVAGKKANAIEEEYTDTTASDGESEEFHPNNRHVEITPSRKLHRTTHTFNIVEGFNLQGGDVGGSNAKQISPPHDPSVGIPNSHRVMDADSNGSEGILNKKLRRALLKGRYNFISPPSAESGSDKNVSSQKRKKRNSIQPFQGRPLPPLPTKETRNYFLRPSTATIDGNKSYSSEFRKYQEKEAKGIRLTQIRQLVELHRKPTTASLIVPPKGILKRTEDFPPVIITRPASSPTRITYARALSAAKPESALEPPSKPEPEDGHQLFSRSWDTGSLHHGDEGVRISAKSRKKRVCFEEDLPIYGSLHECNIEGKKGKAGSPKERKSTDRVETMHEKPNGEPVKLFSNRGVRETKHSRNQRQDTFVRDVNTLDKKSDLHSLDESMNLCLNNTNVIIEYHGDNKQIWYTNQCSSGKADRWKVEYKENQTRNANSYRVQSVYRQGEKREAQPQKTADVVEEIRVPAVACSYKLPGSTRNKANASKKKQNRNGLRHQSASPEYRDKPDVDSGTSLLPLQSILRTNTYMRNPSKEKRTVHWE